MANNEINKSAEAKITAEEFLKKAMRNQNITSLLYEDNSKIGLRSAMYFLIPVIKEFSAQENQSNLKMIESLESEVERLSELLKQEGLG